MHELPPTNKSLGQHWLTDPASLDSIISSAKIKHDDTILEIGPGPGALTALLLRKAHKVVAVEFDETLAKMLPQRLPANNLEVINQDILDFDFSLLPKDYKIVANIPYYLTSNLIRRISETNNRPIMAILLIQKEVAERVCAKIGSMSLLSVTAQYFWEVSLGEKILAHNFNPQPKVDSQILILHRRAQELFTDTQPKEYFKLVRAGFMQRRKTLLNSLRAGLNLSPDVTRQLLQEANIDPMLRAQNLSLDQWYQLYKSYAKSSL